MKFVVVFGACCGTEAKTAARSVFVTVISNCRKGLHRAVVDWTSPRPLAICAELSKVFVEKDRRRMAVRLRGPFHLKQFNFMLAYVPEIATTYLVI